MQTKYISLSRLLFKAMTLVFAVVAMWTCIPSIGLFGKNVSEFFSNQSTKPDSKSSRILTSSPFYELMLTMVSNYTPVMVPETSCREPFVTIEDSGRLGNNVCQLMTLLLFRKDFGLRIAISSSMNRQVSKIFQNLTIPVLPHPCFKPYGSATKEPFHNMYVTVFQRFLIHNTPQLPPRNLKPETYLNKVTGYPCYLDFLLRHRATFQQELTFNSYLLQKAKRKLQNSLQKKGKRPENVVLVSAHIRRTDYLIYSERNNLTLPTDLFYKNAFQFFRDRCREVIFVIISDDPHWAKHKLNGPDVIFPGNSNTWSPELDYIMMSLCNHHIVGSGTFGRTSAFLGNGSLAIFKEGQLNRAALDNIHFNCSTSRDIFYFKSSGKNV